MRHLDEGTIHAWLDGALDDAEAARVGAHVAECATCAAAVAEARGLVAGASRVLSALDHAPANVVPPALKGGASGGEGPDDTSAQAGIAGVTSLGARRSSWRRHMTPARMAAAAVILVASATLLVSREQRTSRGQYAVGPRVPARSSGPGPNVKEPPVSAPAPTGNPDSLPRAEAQVAAPPAADSVSAARTPVLAQKLQAPGRAGNAESDLSKKVVARESAPSAATDVASNAAPGVVSGGASAAIAAAPSAPMPQPVQLRRAPEPLRMEQVVVTSPKDSGGRRSARTRSSDSVVASKEANQRAAAPPRAFDALSSGTTGCYERVVATSDTLVPRRFVLDTLRYALRDGSEAHVVMIPGESTTLPRGYWRIAGGAVEVVWNDNAWPRLTIVPSVAASITAIVNKSPMVSVSLRRCDGR